VYQEEESRSDKVSPAVYDRGLSTSSGVW